MCVVDTSQMFTCTVRSQLELIAQTLAVTVLLEYLVYGIFT